MNDEIEYIIPGETMTPVPEDIKTVRWYWQVLCPHCGKVHGRQITLWWNDNDQVDPEDRDGAVEHHCIICTEHGIHMRMSDKPPYVITREIDYRHRHVTGTTPDNGNIPF